MSRSRWYRSTKYVWLTLLLTLVVGAFGAYKFLPVRADKPNFLTAKIERGDIVTQVGATGTLAAVTTVQVGTQVSGTIAELHADFNSEVKKGQLLAKLDPQLLQAQVQQQEANVRSAEATLNDDTAAIATARANLEKAKVDVLDKQRKFKRQQDLFNENLIARDDLDTAQAALDAAVATRNASEAQLESAQARYKADQARLGQARAALDSARVNLEHTVILSPISGTIISRSVDVGQTVAASFSSPTLFTIAADLTKMQVNTSIDEADVGRISQGMPATFTVDAYPGETFNGTISQIRLAAETVQNVVTYNAIIDVHNPQLKLKPGMTSNVKIVTGKAENVLKIPNAALRFRPSITDQEMEAAFKAAGEEKFGSFYKNTLGQGGQRSPAEASGGAGRSEGNRPAGALGFAGGGGRSGGGSGKGGQTPNRGANRGRRVPVWVLGPDKSLRPAVVRLGLSDGVQTQIEEGKLKEGDVIVTGSEDADVRSAQSPSSRPPGFGGFGPGMGRGSGRR
jgi:HlyD family secretion protein